MRVVIALGGNALRIEPRTTGGWRAQVRALATMAHRHQLVLTHGSEIGHVIGHELDTLLTRHVSIATVLATTEVDAEALSPEPVRIAEIEPIRWLLDKDVVVICAATHGGVTDRDLTGELLAREVNADLFVMTTDVDGVYRDWGTDRSRRIAHTTPDALRDHEFAAGSMGPKVTAAIRFVDRTGRQAAIGALTQIESIVDGVAGTQVYPPHRI